MKKVLIVVDMQNDFVSGALGTQEAVDIVDAVRARVERHREDGSPVLFTMDTHQADDYTRSDRTVEAAKIPAHCIRGTEGWQMIPALRPFSGGAVIEKPTFLGASLAAILKGNYGTEISIELCGVCTDICVVSNALALRAAFPFSEITVQASLCAGSSPENHEAALAVMRSCLINVLL